MEYPRTIPVMMLPKVTLFPHTMLPLFIFEPRYKALVNHSLRTHRLMSVVMTRPGMKRQLPHKVAGLGMIRAAVRHDDGTYHVILQGVARIQLAKAARYKPFRTHDYALIQTQRRCEKRIRGLREKLVDLVSMHLENDHSAHGKLQKCLFSSPGDGNALADMSQLNDVEQLADLVSCTLLKEPFARQVVLEDPNLESRLHHLMAFLMAQIFCPGKKQP